MGLGSRAQSAIANVKSFSSYLVFPPVGESGVLYLDAQNNDIYMWDGAAYEQLNGGGGTTPTETHFFTQIPKFPDSLNYYIADLDHFASGPAPFVVGAVGTDAEAAPLPYDVPYSGANTTTKAIGLFGVSPGHTGTCWAFISVHLGHGNTGSMYVGAHAMRMGMRATFAALSIIGDEEFTFFGLHSHIIGEPNDGVFFRQAPSIGGGTWHAVTKDSNSGNTTAVDTGVMPVVGTYQVLEIEVNRAGTEAKFYINGSLEATITTNLPTSSNMASGLVRNRTSGTTKRRMIVDAIYHANEKLGGR